MNGVMPKTYVTELTGVMLVLQGQRTGKRTAIRDQPPATWAYPNWDTLPGLKAMPVAGPGDRPVVHNEHATPIAVKNTFGQELFAVVSMLAVFG